MKKLIAIALMAIVSVSSFAQVAMEDNVITVDKLAEVGTFFVKASNSKYMFLTFSNPRMDGSVRIADCEVRLVFNEKNAHNFDMKVGIQGSDIIFVNGLKEDTGAYKFGVYTIDGDIYISLYTMKAEGSILEQIGNHVYKQMNK